MINKQSISYDDDHNVSMIDLSYDPLVTITESFYPSVTLSSMMSNFGGVLGLWLGLGLSQIFQISFKISKFMKTLLTR